MAANAAMRTAMERLGFSAAAATALVDDQGLDITSMGTLTDTDVKDMCYYVRKPGGQTAAAAPNPGNSVPFVAELNLKLACYYIRKKQLASRTVTAAMITTDNLTPYRAMKERESNFENPDTADKPKQETIVKDWAKGIELIQEWIGRHRGATSKAVLTYVIRTNEAVPAEHPGAGAANIPDHVDPVNGYSSLEAEIIARADHAGPHYAEDNAMVWDLLIDIMRSSSAYAYMKPHLTTKDGRKAFFALKNHFLGANNTQNLAAKAEAEMMALVYTGEKARFNFEKFLTKHVEIYNRLQDLVAYGYAGIDDGSRVRRLLQGIKCNTLETCKTQILASPTLQTDFDACATLIKDYLAQAHLLDRNRAGANISDVSTKPNRKRSNDDSRNTDQRTLRFDPDTVVEDRYYSREEYAKLTNDQKKKLKFIRQKKNNKKTDRKANVSAVSTSDSNDSTQDEEKAYQEKTNGNSSHPALTRQKGGNKKST